jgi:Rrf2 family nitric oxide-sensitive transcriptional repressor
VTISDVAEFFGISKDHLAKVVQRMVQLGYVRSIRGIHGGIELSRALDTVSVGQVLRDFEGAMHYLECVGSETNVCVIQPGCGLKSVLAEAERLQWAYLDSVMLASVARPGLDLVQLTKPAL